MRETLRAAALANSLQTGVGTWFEGSCGVVDVRESIANDLRASLKNVNRAACTLDSRSARGSSDIRLPKSGRYPALITTARCIVAKASVMETAFLEARMAATFLAELNTLLAKFEEAPAKGHSGRLARVRAIAELKHSADLGVHAPTKLDACGRNHFRNPPEILAAWIQGRHIERDLVRTRQAKPAKEARHPILSVPRAPTHSRVGRST